MSCPYLPSTYPCHLPSPSNAALVKESTSGPCPWRVRCRKDQPRQSFSPQFVALNPSVALFGVSPTRFSVDDFSQLRLHCKAFASTQAQRRNRVSSSSPSKQILHTKQVSRKEMHRINGPPPLSISKNFCTDTLHRRCLRDYVPMVKKQITNNNINTVR